MQEEILFHAKICFKIDFVKKKTSENEGFQVKLFIFRHIDEGCTGKIPIKCRNSQVHQRMTIFILYNTACFFRQNGAVNM